MTGSQTATEITGCQWNRDSERCGNDVVAAVEVAYLDEEELRLCEDHLEQANVDQDGVEVREVV